MEDKSTIVTLNDIVKEFNDCERQKAVDRMADLAMELEFLLNQRQEIDAQKSAVASNGRRLTATR